MINQDALRREQQRARLYFGQRARQTKKRESVRLEIAACLLGAGSLFCLVWLSSLVTI